MYEKCFYSVVNLTQKLINIENHCFQFLESKSLLLLEFPASSLTQTLKFFHFSAGLTPTNPSANNGQLSEIPAAQTLTLSRQLSIFA